MVEICRDPLWNSTQSWDTSSPALSACLHSLLELISAATLLLPFPAWLVVQLGRTSPAGLQAVPRGGRAGWLLLATRLLLCLLLPLTSVLLLLARHPRPVLLEAAGAAGLAGAGILAATAELLLAARLRHTSAMLSLFWVAAASLTSPGLLTAVREVRAGAGPAPLLEFTRWAVLLVGAGLQCFSISSVLPPDLPPESAASAVSRLTFSWLSPLVWRGWRASLTRPDLPDISPAVSLTDNYAKFARAEAEIRQHQSEVSLWRILFRCFGLHYVLGILVFLARLILVFSAPLILRQIVIFVERPDEPGWHGVVYAAALFLCGGAGVLLDHQGLQRVVVAGMQMRNAVVSSVYRKSLRLSSTSRQRFTTGEITNFMAVDAQRLADSVPFSYVVLVAPVDILTCLALLYRLLGPSVLAGLAVLLLVAPVNLWASRQGERQVETQLAAKDKGRLRNPPLGLAVPISRAAHCSRCLAAVILSRRAADQADQRGAGRDQSSKGSVHTDRLTVILPQFS